MTTAREIGRATEGYFRSHAKAFGLDPRAIDVSYVLNRGGFVNFSFRVSDGRSALHVKLSVGEDGQGALRRWHDLDGLLRRYHAPPVVAEVDVGPAQGLVFPFLRGDPPPTDEGVTRSILDCVVRLWGDRELAARLPTGRTVTAAQCYSDTYHDRFIADLDAIALDRPPFLGAGDVDLLRAEAEALSRRVGEAAAFHLEVDGPIHGDLWPDNVLWEGPRSWWLLDWDDLQIGDPAMDLAMLMGPTAEDLRPLKHAHVVEERVSRDVRERLPLLGRASLLDWVIDPVADWIEATVAPERLAEVRVEKERIHRTALELYQASYLA